MVHEVRLQDGIEAILHRPITDAEFTGFDSDVYALTTGSVDERLNASFIEVVDSDSASSVRTAVSFYQVFYGREPDEAGLSFWTEQIESGRSLGDIANEFAIAGEFNSLFGDQPPVAVVSELYRNLLGREPDFEGLSFWSGQVQDGNISLAELGRAFATSPEFQTRADPFIDAFLIAAANGTQDYDVTSSLFDEPLPGAPVETGDLTFTALQDNLQGTDGADTFNAPLTQAGDGSGAVTNSFESGDVFVGGGDTDTLNVDLTATVTGGVPVGPAISTTSTSVENMFFRTQHDSIELSNNLLGLNGGVINSSVFSNIPTSTIDAQNNDGVQQLWSVDSRADLVIEDVREAPSTVTEGFRDSDPGVSYAVFFDPASLRGDVSNSTLNLFLDDANRADLSEFPVDGVVFTLDGVRQQLRVSRDDATTDSYDGFAAALQVAINADTTGDLAGIEVVANAATSTILLTDTNGGIFAPVSYTFVDDQVPFAGNLDFNQTVGQPILGPISTNIVLDGVGRGQEGGVAVFGSMGGRDGIEVFNVTVDDDSWTQLLSSTNNILETINIVEGDTDGDGRSDGDLNIGLGTGANDFIVSNTGFNFPRFDDDRVAFSANAINNSNAGGFGGITDVQTLNASGFANDLKIAARLTDASINKYLTGATDPVTFQYDLADGASNLTIGIDDTFSEVLGQLHAQDANNVINITADGENDRINLSNTIGDAVNGGIGNIQGSIDLSGISIDGNRNTPNTGTDINTLELRGIIAGAAAGVDLNGDGDFDDVGEVQGTAFNSVDDIDNLILAGNVNVAVDATGAGFSGLDNITIKTGGPGTDNLPAANATIINAEADTNISIDGGNQVLGGANGPNGTPVSNSNTAQNFGVVTILNNPNRELEIELNNAANSNGRLTVANLVVGETNANGNAVRTLNIDSNGVNSTSNAVNAINAAEVSTLNFTGTQNLTATVNTLGSVANVDVTISGEDLSGNLDLSVNGAVLNGGDDDQVIGTNGNADELNLSGVFAGGTETQISEFETLNFVNASGTFDATNVVGLDTVSIQDMDGDLILDDLANNVTVNVDDAGNPAEDNNLTLTGRDGGSLTVNLNASSPAFPDGSNNLTDGGGQLDISDVTNATINVRDTGAGVNNITLDLVLDDVTAADVVDNRLQTVTVTSNGNDNVTFLAEFANTLNTIDLSGIGGDTLNVSIFDATPATATQDNDDVRIILNGEGGDFTLIETGDANTVGGTSLDAAIFDDNVVFQFSAVNANSNPELYTIDNFIAFDGDPGTSTLGSNSGNRSVLDLRAFGLTSTADLDIEQNGTNTNITLDGTSDPWQITLIDINADGLGDENFIF